MSPKQGSILTGAPLAESEVLSLPGVTASGSRTIHRCRQMCRYFETKDVFRSCEPACGGSLDFPLPPVTC